MANNPVVVVEDVEKWEAWLEKSETEDMLLVVDAHVDWCGPCETLHPTFTRIYLDTNECDKRVAFLAMNLQIFKEQIRPFLPADSGIDLDQHGCMPFFLLIRQKATRAKVVGANSPQILAMITEHMPPEPENENAEEEA